MSQKCWCSAISALYIEPTAILQKSDSEPSPPTTHVLSRSTCALLAQAVSESTSHTLTCKKLWKPLEIRHSTKFPRICLGSAEPNQQSVSAMASSWGCDLCEKSSVVLCGCEGTRFDTCRHLHSQMGPKQWRSAKSPILPTFPGQALNTGGHGMRGASDHTLAELGAQKLWESAFYFVWVTTNYVFNPIKVFQLMETVRHKGETVQSDPALLKVTSATYKVNCHGK